MEPTDFPGGSTRVLTGDVGLAEAVSVLSAGGVVALPTETVYGLAADATRPDACARIFEAKGRPLSDPLIVHVPSHEWAGRLAIFSETARALADRFWPGPLTLVLPRREVVPDIVTAGQDTVALRMSAHPVFRGVVEAFGRPLAAPSANRFGRISPTCAKDVLEELGGRLPLILDGGRCPHGIESTIVLVRAEALRILRQGPVTAEELSAFGPALGAVPGVTAPGTLASHYAPRTKLRIGPAVPAPRCGLLAWESGGEGFAAVERLSTRGDLREAAANLYGAMRRLDAVGLEEIVAEPLPEIGLGAAIMERLRKASAK